MLIGIQISVGIHCVGCTTQLHSELILSEITTQLTETLH